MTTEVRFNHDYLVSLLAPALRLINFHVAWISYTRVSKIIWREIIATFVIHVMVDEITLLFYRILPAALNTRLQEWTYPLAMETDRDRNSSSNSDTDGSR